jgi:hypothetical protein
MHMKSEPGIETVTAPRVLERPVQLEARVEATHMVSPAVTLRCADASGRLSCGSSASTSKSPF